MSTTACTNTTSCPTEPGRSISRSTPSPSVVGHGIGTDSEQQFLPFYTAYSSDETHQHSAYFTMRREPRLTSLTAKRRGPRSSYIGTEVFLSLVDPKQAPYSGDLRQLSIETLCTNRDLALQMAKGADMSDLSLDVAAPVKNTRVISGPSRPYAPLADGAVSWRAISHLSLNYLSLVQSTPGGRGRRTARSARAVRGQRRPQRAAPDRRDPIGARGARRAPAARAGPAGLRPRPRDHAAGRRAGVRRARARSCSGGARSIFRAPRLDQLVY